MPRIEPLFTTECDAGIYTKSKKHIQYVPRSSEVVTADMTYDLTKYRELRNEIAQANISDDARAFLNFAATRHITFNYSMVAEYYAQAPKEVQALMEKSGLVILDFEDAIENGFVDLTETLKSLREEDRGSSNAS